MTCLSAASVSSALPVRTQQAIHRCLAVRLDHVIDDEPALVVRERNALRILEGFVQILELDVLLAIEDAREHVFARTRPVAPRLGLLPLGDAFGQPARHALIRHLQRDDVAELVPQRRLPEEIADGTSGHAAASRA